MDPIFMCELALELHMPISELGERMSAHELTVIWPEFFRYRERERERAEAEFIRRTGWKPRYTLDESIAWLLDHYRGIP
jgi:nucleoside-diphosphate-sugar epimerase